MLTIGVIHVREKTFMLQAVPGRIHLSNPLFSQISEPSAMESMLENLDGIRLVKIEPYAESTLVQYDISSIREQDVLHCISLFCQCLEGVDRDQEGKMQTRALQSIMISWLSLESHIGAFADDKALINEYFRMLASITRQFVIINNEA